MEKLSVDFEIPEWLEKVLDKYIERVNKDASIRGMMVDDVFSDLEESVYRGELTVEQAEILNLHYCGRYKPIRT